MINMNNQLLDLYSDYLISSFGQTTATRLATLLGGSISHDKITRFLASQPHTSADLWKVVKPYVRQIQSEDSEDSEDSENSEDEAQGEQEDVLIVDDSIAEKPYTDENDIICWHYDHSSDRQVKGINFLTALYHSYRQGVSLPVGFALVAKTERYIDKKDGKEKRRSPISKNEHYRRLLQQAVNNQIPFGYVLNDLWYASAENMKFIKHSLKKDFIMPIKANRKVALCLADKQQGRYVRVDSLVLEPNVSYEVYLEGVDFPLLLVKQVFVNEDGSRGILYLVTSDTTLTYDGIDSIDSIDSITTIYHTRWNVETYHKSLKQNASLEKSPTQTVVTQTNHFFAALCAYIKLEMLRVSTKLNHFALKTKLYVNALQVAFSTLQEMQPVRLAA